MKKKTSLARSLPPLCPSILSLLRDRERRTLSLSFASLLHSGSKSASCPLLWLIDNSIASRVRGRKSGRKEEGSSKKPIVSLFLSLMPTSSSSSNPPSRPVPWLASPPGPYIAGFRANILDFMLRSGAAQELPTPPRLVSPSENDNDGRNAGGSGSRRNKKNAPDPDRGAPLRAWLVPLAWPRGSPPAPPPPPLYVVEEGLDEENPLVCDRCRIIGKKERVFFLGVEGGFFSLLPPRFRCLSPLTPLLLAFVIAIFFTLSSSQAGRRTRSAPRGTTSSCRGHPRLLLLRLRETRRGRTAPCLLPRAGPRAAPRPLPPLRPRLPSPLSRSPGPERR